MQGARNVRGGSIEIAGDEFPYAAFRFAKNL
jgi:hypothetical protein